MTTTVYVLRLKSGKYYVGKTNNVERRLEEHLSGGGAAWTRKYKPISVEKTFPNAGSFDEDKITKEYMGKHGIENVRGGTYVSVVLDEYHKAVLTQEIWSATGCCTRCGRKGHFVKNCYAETTVDGEEFEEDEDEDEEDEDDDEDEDEEEEEY